MIIVAKFASVCPCCSSRIDVGSKVDWSKGEKARHVACPASSARAAGPAKARRQAAPRLPAITGVESTYVADFEGDKHDRSPQRELGSASWLRHGKALIAVVLTGWEPARWVSAELAEDMGHYMDRSKYLGSLHLRAATVAEYEALQATSPRAEGSCVEIVQAVVAALAVAS